MAKSNITSGMNINTKDIDRIAIGCRLYDAFDTTSAFNILHSDDGKLYVHECDIEKMFQLVNQNIYGPKGLMVYRKEESK